MNRMQWVLWGWLFVIARATQPCFSACHVLDKPHDISIEEVDPFGDLNADREIFCAAYVEYFGRLPKEAAINFDDSSWDLRLQAKNCVGLRAKIHNEIGGFFVLRFPETQRIHIQRFALNPACSRIDQEGTVEALVAYLFDHYGADQLTVIIGKYHLNAQQMIQQYQFVSAPLKDDGYSSELYVAFDRERKKISK